MQSKKKRKLRNWMNLHKKWKQTKNPSTIKWRRDPAVGHKVHSSLRHRETDTEIQLSSLLHLPHSILEEKTLTKAKHESRIYFFVKIKHCIFSSIVYYIIKLQVDNVIKHGSQWCS